MHCAFRRLQRGTEISLQSPTIPWADVSVTLQGCVADGTDSSVVIQVLISQIRLNSLSGPVVNFIQILMHGNSKHINVPTSLYLKGFLHS